MDEGTFENVRRRSRYFERLGFLAQQRMLSNRGPIFAVDKHLDTKRIASTSHFYLLAPVFAYNPAGGAQNATMAGLGGRLVFP